MNIPPPFSRSSTSSGSSDSSAGSFSSSSSFSVDSLSSSSSSNFTVSPRSIYTEDVVGDDGKLAINFLAYPKYYESEINELLETDTTLVVSNAPGWDWEVTKGIWTVHVSRDGTYESNFKGAKINRRLVGIGFYDNAAKAYIPKIDLDVDTWKTVVEFNEVQWTNDVNDIIYTVRYQHDHATSIVVIPQAIKDWLIANAPAKDIDEDGEETIPGRYLVCVRYDSDIDFLGDGDSVNKIEYIIEEDEDSSSSSLSSKSNGKGKPDKPEKKKIHKITVGSLWVIHQSIYNTEIEDESLRWRKRRTHKTAEGYYLESCHPKALYSPEGALVFNDVDAFRQNFDGYTGSDDTTIPSDKGQYLVVEKDWVFSYGDYLDVQSPLIRYDLTGELPSENIVITEGLLLLRCQGLSPALGSSQSCSVRGVWKNWNAGNVDGSRFDTVDQLYWHGGSTMATERSDATYFNDFNGYGYDTTEDKNIQGVRAGYWSSFIVPLWHLQRQYEQDKWRGWYIHTEVPGSPEGNINFYSNEYVTEAFRPVLQITYELISSSSSFSSSSFSSCSSSWSSVSVSSSSSSGHFDVKLGDYTELRNVRFEVDNPTGVEVNKHSVVYNCYARNFSNTSGYHAWNSAYPNSQISFLMCEGVSDNGYAFFMDRSTSYCEVLISGCIAHDSLAGIRSDRYTYMTNNLIWDCDYGIQVWGSSSSGAGCNCYIIGNTIYNVDYGIYPLGASYAGGGMYVINNIIDTCAVAGFYSTGFSRHSYFDYNNWNNNLQDIQFDRANKGPNATALDPAFFDPGANDFRIGQHMRNLGFRTNFGNNTGYVANASMSYPNQGAIQRRETIGNDAPLWETAGQAHTGTGYIRMYPSRGTDFPQKWEFMTPCYEDQDGAITFWSKGSHSGTFRIAVTGDGVSIDQGVSVTGGYTETVISNVNPSSTGYLTVTFTAAGVGTIYIDDFVYSQSSSSSSFSSSSFSSASFSSSSSST